MACLALNSRVESGKVVTRREAYTMHTHMLIRPMKNVCWTNNIIHQTLPKHTATKGSHLAAASIHKPPNDWCTGKIIVAEHCSQSLAAEVFREPSLALLEAGFLSQCCITLLVWHNIPVPRFFHAVLHFSQWIACEMRRTAASDVLVVGSKQAATLSHTLHHRRIDKDKNEMVAL